MIEHGRNPGIAGVAVIAGGAARDVIRGLAGGGGAVVTAETGAGCDAGMIKCCRDPGVGGVAIITGSATRDMI